MPAVSARPAGKPRTSMRASPLPTGCLLLMAEPMRAETLAPSSTATRSDEMTLQLLTPMRELDRRQTDGGRPRAVVRGRWKRAGGGEGPPDR